MWKWLKHRFADFPLSPCSYTDYGILLLMKWGPRHHCLTWCGLVIWWNKEKIYNPNRLVLRALQGWVGFIHVYTCGYFWHTIKQLHSCFHEANSQKFKFALHVVVIDQVLRNIINELQIQIVDIMSKHYFVFTYWFYVEIMNRLQCMACVFTIVTHKLHLTVLMLAWQSLAY